MQLDAFYDKIKDSREKLNQIQTALNFDKKNQELIELEKQEENPEMWSNPELMKKHNQKKKGLLNVISEFSSVKSCIEDFEALLDLASEGMDITEREIQSDCKKMEKLLDDLWLTTLLSDKYDDCNCILTLHAGAGGEEAQDWTDMLSRMYLRYAEKQGFSAVVVDETPGDGAGLKSQTIEIDGLNAYGYLKCEKGVHRLVRISPFDANKRRHTSFSSVEVSPLIDDDNSIEIRPEDIRIDTYRSGGAGGQHVNKTDSAVRITHISTGIVVQCQNERSQIQNKEQAMNMLKGKLAMKAEEDRLAKMAEIQGEVKKNEWGSQIRSYVLHPYNMVKDHRTDFETSNTTSVLDGDIHDFICEMLKFNKN